MQDQRDGQNSRNPQDRSTTKKVQVVMKIIYFYKIQLNILINNFSKLAYNAKQVLGPWIYSMTPSTQLENQGMEANEEYDSQTAQLLNYQVVTHIPKK